MFLIKGRALPLMVLSFIVMVFGAGCDELASTLIVEGETLFAPTDTPVPPTDTPIPPTDTPVPTATVIKVAMVDEEGDCEFASGNPAEDDCPIDLASFEVLLCHDNDTTLFQVGFHALSDAKTFDICFTINADNDRETGFQADPTRGVDAVICWSNPNQYAFYNVFASDGELIDQAYLDNPLSFIGTDADGHVRTSPFEMLFPPPGFPEHLLNDTLEVGIDAQFWDQQTEDWSQDQIDQVLVDIEAVFCGEE